MTRAAVRARYNHDGRMMLGTMRIRVELDNDCLGLYRTADQDALTDISGT